jgi:hypothetical protein
VTTTRKNATPGRKDAPVTHDEIWEEYAKLEWDIRITRTRLANALTRRDFTTVNDMERHEAVIRERLKVLLARSLDTDT